jgi:hypothetical protein
LLQTLHPAQIHARNLAPALEWAAAHRTQLSAEGRPSSFEFKLHTLAFIHTLTRQGPSAALQYAKQHFSSFKVGEGEPWSTGAWGGAATCSTLLFDEH